MLCVPESPRYLVEIGDYEGAGKALSWLYGLSQKDIQDDLKQVNLQPYFVDEERK